MTQNQSQESDEQFLFLEDKLLALENFQITREEFESSYQLVKKLIQSDTLFQRKKILLKIDSRRNQIINKHDREGVIQKLVYNSKILSEIINQIQTNKYEDNSRRLELINKGQELVDNVSRQVGSLQEKNELCVKTQKLMKDAITLIGYFQIEVEVSEMPQSMSQSVRTLKECTISLPSMPELDQKSIDIFCSQESVDSNNQNSYQQYGLHQIFSSTSSNPLNRKQLEFKKSDIGQIKKKNQESLWDIILRFLSFCSLCSKAETVTYIIKGSDNSQL